MINVFTRLPRYLKAKPIKTTLFAFSTSTWSPQTTTKISLSWTITQAALRNNPSSIFNSLSNNCPSSNLSYSKPTKNFKRKLWTLINLSKKYNASKLKSRVKTNLSNWKKPKIKNLNSPSKPSWKTNHF